MMSISVSKQLPGFKLDVEFNLADKIVFIRGASGAGKTTLLKCISGLLKPDCGEINLNGSSFFNSNKNINTSPQQREIGISFQDYLLFPHLSTRDNITYGLTLHENLKDNMLEKVTTGLELEEKLLRKLPDELSGGEKQRVSLARALLRGKNLLLLDEPFNALNQGLKQEVIKFVFDWVNYYGVPAIIVSHMAVCDINNFETDFDTALIELESGAVKNNKTTSRTKVIS